jgi:hypothetical protein
VASRFRRRPACCRGPGYHWHHCHPNSMPRCRLGLDFMALPVVGDVPGSPSSPPDRQSPASSTCRARLGNGCSRTKNERRSNCHVHWFHDPTSSLRGSKPGISRASSIRPRSRVPPQEPKFRKPMERISHPVRCLARARWSRFHFVPERASCLIWQVAKASMRAVCTADSWQAKHLFGGPL